jgi:single-stranded-DNA-specific exonuclease
LSVSFSNRIWEFLEYDAELVRRISQEFDISELAATILLNRGIIASSEIRSFLNPKLRDTIPDPSLFLGMTEAVERIVHAVLAKENIMIFGDYDVDGITATYLMVHYLKILGIDAKYHIPSRFTDGYGINSEAIQRAKELQIDLFIAVDSGTNSISEIEEANNFGMDVIVLDHHAQTVDALPSALAVVNPNRNDQPEVDGYHTKNLCAAGVVFMALIAIQRHLKSTGFFSKDEPNLMDLADIVAIGTLCDVVDLKGFNRVIVKYCIENGVRSVGLLALMKAFNIVRVGSPEDLSFFVGPAMNAAGRIGNPLIALELLLEPNPEKAHEIANKLKGFNARRKDIEKKMLSEALVMISKSKMDLRNGICVHGEDWHEGVIGIVAGRLKNMYGKPIFVIAFDEDGTGKGSARSVPGLHLGEFFAGALKEGIIIKGGGHALAGGFSISIDKLSAFHTFIDENILQASQNTLAIDYTLRSPANLDAVADEIGILGPFGKGMEKPLLRIPRIIIKKMVPTQTGDHMSLDLRDEFGLKSVRGIIFGISTKAELMKALHRNQDTLVDIVGYVSRNKYGCSILVEDVSPVVNR